MSVVSSERKLKHYKTFAKDVNFWALREGYADVENLVYKILTTVEKHNLYKFIKSASYTVTENELSLSLHYKLKGDINRSILVFNIKEFLKISKWGYHNEIINSLNQILPTNKRRHYSRQLISALLASSSYPCVEINSGF